MLGGIEGRIAQEAQPARTPGTRRTVLLVGASGAAALGLSACGQTSGGSDTGGRPAASGPPVEIVYQTFFAQQRLDVMAPAIRVFHEQNPNIKTNLVYDPDHRNKLNTQMAADSAPDTFIHDVWSTMKYVDAGALMDLTGRLKTDKVDLGRDYYTLG